MKLIEVRTKEELCDALYTSKDEEVDCVIEVASSIETNAAFHRCVYCFKTSSVSLASLKTDCRQIVPMI